MHDSELARKFLSKIEAMTFEEIDERFYNYEIDEAETITLLFESLDTKKAP